MKTTWYCQIGNVAPERIRLLPLGEVRLGDGREPFRVTDGSLESIVEAWKGRGNEMVIDYEHQTVTGKEAPAAGWIKELWPGPDGLWGRVVWTDRARDYIENREYRYFSPVVQLGEGREVVDLLHVALTNIPAMSNLSPLVLQDQTLVDGERENELEKGVSQVRQEEKMGSGARGEAGEASMMEDLRLILGLAAGAEAAQVCARVTDLLAGRDEKSRVVPLELCSSLGLGEDAALEAAVQRIVWLQAEAAGAAALREEVVVLRQEKVLQEARHLLEEALNSKKTTPGELNLANGRLRRLAQEDPEFFRELILTRPANWAVPGPLGQACRRGAALSEEERSICQTFNITPEAFMKNRVFLEKGE